MLIATGSSLLGCKDDEKYNFGKAPVKKRELPIVIVPFLD
jgi:hypothetical protein